MRIRCSPCCRRSFVFRRSKCSPRQLARSFSLSRAARSSSARPGSSSAARDFVSAASCKNSVVTSRSSIIAKGVVLPPHPSLGPAAIFPRTVAVSSRACRIVSTRFDWLALLQPDLVPPGNVEVVLVKEPAAFAQLQFAKRLGRGPGSRLPRAIPRGVNDELIKVDAFPSHYDLKDAMKFAQADCRENLDLAPHHRAYVFQPDTELQGENFILRGRRVPASSRCSSCPLHAHQFRRNSMATTYSVPARPTNPHAPLWTTWVGCPRSCPALCISRLRPAQTN